MNRTSVIARYQLAAQIIRNPEPLSKGALEAIADDFDRWARETDSKSPIPEDEHDWATRKNDVGYPYRYCRGCGIILNRSGNDPKCRPVK